MKTVYFIRHGESTANINSTFGGGLDVALTDLGRVQAENIGKTIAARGLPIEAMITSDLVRAKETSQISARQFGFSLEKIEVDPRIRELSSGVFEGQELSSINLHKRDIEFFKPENDLGVEPLSRLVDRLQSFKADLEQRSEDTILLVGHGFSGRMLRRLFKNIELTIPLPQMPNAEIMQLYPYQELEMVGKVKL